MSNPQNLFSLTIEEAEKLCKEKKKVGILILSFDDKEAFYITTYGKSKPLCKSMKRVSEQIAKQLESGEIKLL